MSLLAAVHLAAVQPAREALPPACATMRLLGPFRAGWATMVESVRSEPDMGQELP